MYISRDFLAYINKYIHTRVCTHTHRSLLQQVQAKIKTKTGNKMSLVLLCLGLTHLPILCLFLWDQEFWLLIQILISTMFSILPHLAQRETATPIYF